MKRKHFYLLLCTIVLASCSGKRNEEKEYKEALESGTVSAWKTAKTLIRATSTIKMEPGDVKEAFNVSADSTANTPELLSFVSDLQHDVMYDSTGKPTEAVNYMRLCKEIYGLKDAVNATDEDQYPLLLQRFSGDSGYMALNASLSSSGYTYDANMEHFLLCMIATFSVKTPREICLYELSQIEQNKMPRNEMYVVTTVLAAANFILSEWNYLAEDRCTQALEELDRASFSAPLLSAKTQGKIKVQDDPMAKAFFKATIYASRAWVRSQMDEDKAKEGKSDALRAAELMATCGMTQSDDYKMIAAMLQLEDGNIDEGKKFLEEVANSPSADEETRKSASQALDRLNSGKSDEAVKEMMEKTDDSSLGLMMAKDMSSYMLNEDSASEMIGTDSTGNPLYDYSKLYMKKYDEVTSYMSLEGASDKVKSWFE